MLVGLLCKLHPKTYFYYIRQTLAKNDMVFSLDRERDYISSEGPKVTAHVNLESILLSHFK